MFLIGNSQSLYRPVVSDPLRDAVAYIKDLRVAHLFNQVASQRAGAAPGAANQNHRIMFSYRGGQTVQKIRHYTRLVKKLICIAISTSYHLSFE